jgi:hypothetical protein
MEKIEFKVNGKITVEQYEDRIVILIDEEKPKHKEPIIGELAILWDDRKRLSLIDVFVKNDGIYPHLNMSMRGVPYKNAILFESLEQYKNFIKG